MIKHTYKIEFSLFVLVFFSLWVSLAPIINGQGFHLDPDILNKAESKYGKGARSLLVAWEELITQNIASPDQIKLKKVNDFFNRMEFVDDIVHWGQKDYWATPLEFLESGAGDCEDFAIAKYFTLKAMGVREDRLNLTYVKALRYNIHHMVLTYYSTPTAEPFVLDNLVGEILAASQRPDLLPIYSFNGTSLWLAKQRGKGKLAGSSSRLQRWQELMQRMAESNLKSSEKK